MLKLYSYVMVDLWSLQELLPRNGTDATAVEESTEVTQTIGEPFPHSGKGGKRLFEKWNTVILRFQQPVTQATLHLRPWPTERITVDYRIFYFVPNNVWT